MISFSNMLRYFKDEEKSVRRGENHYSSGHILACTVSQGQLIGSVRASMKNKNYRVVISTGDSGVITSTVCDCPRGEHKCSHAAALMIWGIHNLSSTDVECQWKKPKLPEEVKAVEDLFPKEKVAPPAREPNTDDHEWLRREFQGRWTGIAWILQPEPEPSVNPNETLLDLTAGSIIASNQHLGSDGILAAMHLTVEQIMAIQSATVGQKDCELWHTMRKGRLTASNFGSVLLAKRVTPSLISKVCQSKPLDGVQSVQWGIANEQEGIHAFQKQTGMKVRGSGLWLSRSGILGATPDGLVAVGDTDLIEVKCPYTWRDQTVEEAAKQKSFYLLQVEDGTYRLKENHRYWHQVQGQLHLAQKTTCYFTTWTLKQCVISTIVRDESWQANMGILEAFYKTNMLPKLPVELSVKFVHSSFILSTG